MISKRRIALLALLAVLCLAIGAIGDGDDGPKFQDTFRIDRWKLRTVGRNDFFSLIPGYSLLLEGEEDSETIVVWIKVLPRTKRVNGVHCRVIREMEWIDDELVEISHNYYAICSKTGTVFYFGEDVDIYEDGEVVSHDGAWLAGKDGAKPGVIMPGYPLLASRYYQEVAPGIALDRAEHKKTTATIRTPAGRFENCLRVKETTPLEPGESSIKIYAPGVGLVRDGAIKLVKYGFRVKYEPEGD